MPDPSARSRHARLALVAAALLFSTGGAAIKASDLPPEAIAPGRSLVAFLTLAWVARAQLARPRALELATALGYAATLSLYVFANRATTAASAVFLQGAAPLYLLFLAPLFLRERPRRRDVALLAVMALGLALFFLSPGAAQNSAPAPLLGNLLGGLSGMTWACTLLGLRALARAGRPALPAVVLGNALVVLALGPFVPAGLTPTATDLAVLLWLGAFQIGLAYVLTARGVAHVPAFETSLLFLLEPAFGPLWAYLLHGERCGPSELLGGVILIVAGGVATLRPAGHST